MTVNLCRLKCCDVLQRIIQFDRAIGEKKFTKHNVMQFLCINMQTYWEIVTYTPFAFSVNIRGFSRSFHHGLIFSFWCIQILSLFRLSVNPQAVKNVHHQIHMSLYASRISQQSNKIYNTFISNRT